MLKVFRNRLDVPKFLFGRRVVPIWNRLIDRVVMGSSVAQFERRLGALKALCFSSRYLKVQDSNNIKINLSTS